MSAAPAELTTGAQECPLEAGTAMTDEAMTDEAMTDSAMMDGSGSGSHPPLQSESAAGPGLNWKQQQAKRKAKERCSKKVHVAFLPERYEPLIEEDDIKESAKEDRKQKRKEKYKKYRKNVGKALRFSWKCLVAGLQIFTAAYSAPVSAATVLMTNSYRTRT
ncbi:uncharacterized protein C1orf115 homolog [Anguilla anguilla]|uniref:uncharacterized protein C1orf115 homolog n=1 Tax=Anguilla anguilla TaxID=7936 RepID=UPI0015B1C2C6|nr:uncharacterized protein C1orf115 homolog [Anguilla anguilla]